MNAALLLSVLTLTGCTMLLAPSESAQPDGPSSSPTTASSPRTVTDPSDTVGPRPTLILLASDAALTLESPTYRPVTEPARAAGWLIVSMDVPGAGADLRPGEDPDENLKSWASRITNGENVVTDFTTHMRASIDALIASQRSDPARIVVVGISRGGFLALHLAAVDPRIRAVAAIAPVTELSALKEFAGVTSPLVRALDIQAQAPRLTRLPLFTMIAENDQRVGTAPCLAFVDQVRRSGGSVTLEVYPGVSHNPPESLLETAGRWIIQR